jgi:hypothetical protein
MDRFFVLCVTMAEAWFSTSMRPDAFGGDRTYVDPMRRAASRARRIETTAASKSASFPAIVVGEGCVVDA